MKKIVSDRPYARAFIVLFILVAGLSTAVAAKPVQEDRLERDMLEIAKDLRCTVCQNQPVAESNADLAKDMRQIIREQLIAGKSRDEIVNYFVSRYGDYVLMKPPVDRAGLPLWIFPPLLLATLALLSWFFLRQRSRIPPPPAPILSKQDEALVRAARGQQTQGSAKIEKSKKNSKKKSKKGMPT